MTKKSSYQERVQKRRAGYEALAEKADQAAMRVNKQADEMSHSTSL